MTDDDKALDKIIRASMPLDFERKETLSDDKALVERLRWSDGWFFENPWDHAVYASDDPLEAADRIEAQAAEIERLREALVTVRARIEDIENPFEDGTKQEHIAFEKAVDAASLIASAALGETE